MPIRVIGKNHNRREEWFGGTSVDSNEELQPFGGWVIKNKLPNH